MRIKKILTSRPVNKTTARVVSPAPSFGQVIDVDSLSHIRTSQHAPLPTKSAPNNIIFNCTGAKIGSLTVIGYAEDQGSKNQANAKGSRWVVRCVCGLYEYRRSKSIRNPLNTDDKCTRCEIRIKTTTTHVRCNQCEKLVNKLRTFKGLCTNCIDKNTP